MAGNTIGQMFRVTTFGESHGLALGCIVDGCPPGLELSLFDLQKDLDRRRPGTSKYTTSRRELDTVKILSGVFEGKTTGTPIGLLIENTDQRSQDIRHFLTVFGRVTQIILTIKNTGYEITVVAGVPQREKPPCGWRQEGSRKNT